MTDLWELTKKAKAGDIEAQLAVAHAFETGEGIKINESEALKWFRMAAEQGDAEGAYQTAKLLPRFLLDTDEDELNPEVISYLKSAAEKGHLKAQKEFALYQPGYYAPITNYNINVEERLFCLEKAAEQDDAEAMRELGMTYYNEPDADYLKTDYKKAVFWLKKASDKGDGEAKLYLAKCYKHGDGTEKNPKKRFSLYKEAAECDFEEAMGEVGICYLNGIGTDEDEDEAFHWFKEGAEHQDPDLESCYQLGLCYLNGHGTDTDEKSALYYFHEAVNWANIYGTRIPKAEYMIGECYYEGYGTDVNYKEAIYWFERAAEKNDVDALYMLGECYFYGYGVRKNRKKALKYYHKTEEYDVEHKDALYSLGCCYANGLGTERNILKGVYWYSIAEYCGSNEAEDELDKLLKRK